MTKEIKKTPTKKSSPKKQKKGAAPMPPRGMALSFLMMALFITLMYLLSDSSGRSGELDYSEFVNRVKTGRIAKVDIAHDGAGNHTITGEAKDVNESGSTQFKTEIILTDSLMQLLEEHQVQVTIKRPRTLIVSILANLIPFLLVFGIIYFVFIRQMKNSGRGAMSFGKSRAKLLTRDKNKITFAQVAGVDEAKEELEEVVDFLKDPKQFQKLGGKMPKGVLLCGPPGTGKTLLAKAVAGEADVPFFTISGSDFVEMFVGIGASRVRDMFEQGKKNAPCIIFIDEIDAVGRSRFSGIGGGHDEREQTLNALLVEMDGFDTQEGIIIVAATNRPDVLDQALLRPGRFDRQVMVDLPSLKGREMILQIHARNVRLSDQVQLADTARGTPGFSGADLANLINEAALLASRRKANFVEQEDLEEARDKVIWGRERRSHALDKDEKRLTAYHEAGHAIAMYHMEECEPIHKVTIIPRGKALGATMQLPKKDRYTQSQKRLEADLVAFMGGRAAEELIFGDITTGAHNDIERSTAIARAMVCEYGMSKKVGPQNLSSNREPIFMGQGMTGAQEYSEKTANLIDEEVQRILNTSYETCMNLLVEHKESLINLSEILIEKEVLDAKEVISILETGQLPEKPTPPEVEPEESPMPPAEEAVTPECAEEPSSD
jgi:cell division protease FtsH